MSRRQRSGTMMPQQSPNKRIATRRRSGANAGLGIPKGGFRQTFSYKSINETGLKIEEDPVVEEINSPMLKRKVDVAENQFKKRKNGRNQSQFVDAGIELSDSDYSFDSDHEEEDAVKKNVFSKILNKKKEAKLDSLKEEKEVYNIYLQAKEYTKEYIKEREKVKRSSGRLHINMDLLDLLPGNEKVSFDEKSHIEPEDLWSKVESEYGEPTSFGINSTGSVIAIGTKTSKIVIFNKQKQDFKQINYNSIQSSVTCLHFHDERQMLFAGYESGAVVIFKYHQDANTSGYKRHIKVADASNSPVTHIRQVNNMKNMLITDRECRILYGVKVGKKDTDKFQFNEVFMGNRDSFSVLETFEVFKRQIVVLTSGSKATIFVLKPGLEEPLVKVAQIGAPRGQKKSFESFPILSTLKYQKILKINILSLVWGYHISSYVIKPSNNNEIEIDLKDNLDFSDKIISASKFDNHNICLVDEKGKISLYNVQNHLDNKRKKEEKEQKRRRGTMAFNAAMSKRKKQKDEEDEEDAILAIPAPPPVLRSGTMMIHIPDYNKEKELKRKGSEVSEETSASITEEQKPPNSERSLFKGASLLLKEAVTSKFVTKTNFSLDPKIIEYFDKKDFTEKERPASVFLRAQNSQLFCFTKKNLEIYELKSWIDFLNECIQKECFMFGLKCINEILDLSNDIDLREIPQNRMEMMNELKPILLLIITKIFPAMQDKTEYVSLMANLSMFILLKAEMGEYIATQLEAVMEGFGFESQYLKNLKLFYEGSLIPILPEEKIKKILVYLKSKPVQRNQFLNFIFKRKKNLKEFAVEYARTHEDTFEVYTIFTVNGKNPEDSGLPLKNLYQQLKAVKETDDKEKANLIVTRMIWYVYEICLRTEKKYGDLTSKDKSWHVFQTFLDDELIKDVINTNTIHYLNCFKFLLARNLGKQFSRLSEPLKDIKIREKKEEEKILDEEKSSKYIVYLFDKFDEYVEESHRFQFNFFLCNLILKPVENVIISGNFIKQLFTSIVDKFHDFINDGDIKVNEDDIVMLLFSLYTNNRTLFEGDAQIFNSLKEKSKKLMLIQYEMKKNQKATFALFQRLVTDNAEYKTELFGWLAAGLKRPEDKQRMLKVIDEEYIYLIKLDHKNYARLLESLTIEEQMDYIMKYKPTTKSKLEIFKRILTFVKKKHMENEITNEFKVEYINLLNKHEKKRVLPELMTGKYPSASCLQTCLDSKNFLAVAYIKERLGYYQEAMTIYKQRLRKVLKSLSRGGRIDIPGKKERMLGRLHKEFQMALNLCRDAEGSEKFFVLTTERYKKRRIKEWIKVSEKLLDYILSVIPPKTFIAKIEDPEYPFVRDEHLMERTVNHFKSLKGIYNSNKRVNASDWWDKNDGLMDEMIYGKQCEVKDDPDAVGDSALLFKYCPHTFEVCKTECKGQPIYCDICEAKMEKIRAYNRLIRFWKREKMVFRPSHLITKKRMLLHEIFKGLQVKSLGKQKVYLDKYDKEKQKIDDFVNYMTSEAGFSEIDTGASMIA